MLRFLLFVFALSALAGCQSRYGGAFGSCGTRIPPPPTGSYGVPNTYYPNVAPRASNASAVAPSTLSSTQGTWRSVDDAENSVTPSVAATSSSENEAVGSSVRTASATITGTRVSTTKASSGQGRLNGMPVNEVKSPVAPATFLSPVDSSQSPASDGTQPSFGTTSAEAWQSRAAPAPGRASS
jgi:hypothetical protein